MFSGTLSPYVPYALTITLITAAIGGLYGMYSEEATFVTDPIPTRRRSSPACAGPGVAAGPPRILSLSNTVARANAALSLHD